MFVALVLARVYDALTCGLAYESIAVDTNVFAKLYAALA